eukprot:3796093-Rhodomonas_salina.2
MMKDCHRRAQATSLSQDEQQQVLQFQIHHRNTTVRACSLEMEGRVEPARWIKLYQQGAAHGCTAAMFALSRIFFRGDGVPVDHERGFQWASECVKSGPSIPHRLICGRWDPALLSALQMLGHAHRHGWGVKKDAKLAEEYMSKSAQGGDSLAANNLGTLLCEKGQFEEANSWYRKSAEARYPRAMCNLATSLAYGRGCEKDVKEAVFWLEKARDSGESLAMVLLADLARDSGESEASIWEQALEQQKGHASPHIAVMAFASRAEEQRKQDTELSTEAIFDQLCELDMSPPKWRETFGDSDTDCQPTTAAVLSSVESYREALVSMLLMHRPLTDLEHRAVSAIEERATEDGSCALMLGQFLASRGQIEKAISVFEQGAKLVDTECALEAGRQWMLKGNAQLAAKFLRQAVACGSEDAMHLFAELRSKFELFETNVARSSSNDYTKPSEHAASRFELVLQGASADGFASPAELSSIRKFAKLCQQQEYGPSTMTSSRMCVPTMEL